MSGMKKLLLSAGIICGLAGMSGISYGQDILKVGVNAAYPPFEYNDFGKLKGFDVDLITQIAKKLHMKVQFSDMPFASIIPSIKNGRSDVGISAISITPQRRKTVDFTNEYYQSKMVILTKNKHINKLDDIAGKNISAGQGTIMDLYAKYLLKNHMMKFNYRALKGNPTLMNEIKLGRIDAMVTEDVVGYANQKKMKSVRLVEIPLARLPKAYKSGYAMALKKGSPLTKKINVVLRELKEDGTIDRLETKWIKSLAK